MIITDNSVFIHLQKCAGTTIEEFMIKVFPNHIKTKAKHLGISKIPEEHRHKLIFGTIRNPWDWYVSWYSFRKKDWDPHFKDLFNCGFKEFLKRCFFEETRKLHDIDFSKIKKKNIGPYPNRYNRCYDDMDSGLNFNIIKTENLREGLIALLELNESQIKVFDGMEKMNSSEHNYYLEYYDQEMIDWIKEKDKKIIKNHNYKEI